jgi:hypothetical protein
LLRDHDAAVTASQARHPGAEPDASEAAFGAHAAAVHFKTAVKELPPLLTRRERRLPILPFPASWPEASAAVLVLWRSSS